MTPDTGLAAAGATTGRGAPALRPYQSDGLAATAAARDQGLNRILLKLPTGTGKTVMFAAMLQWPALKAWLETFPVNQRRMLVIAHREELLEQAAEKIQRANPGLMVAIEQGDRHANGYSDVVVASIQTLQAMKFRRLQRLLTRHNFRLVIVDEAHHAAAPTYRTALVHLGFLPPADISESGELEAASHDDVAQMAQALEGWDLRAPKDRLLVGVTATPNRTDAIGLGCVFQTIAYSYALRAAIEDGWLVPITPWVVETSESLDGVRITAGEFNQKDLASTVNTPARNRLAVDAWQRYAAGRSTIAFSVDVAHAHALADAFVAAGVRAKAISGETPKDERRATLSAFTRGELDIITNCMVLTEGTDLPLASCILHAKPTKSATLYEQMTGRGLRIHPGKTDCVVIDLVDIARKHSLQTAPVLYGLPPGLSAKGKNLATFERELDEFRQKHPGFDVDEAIAAGARTLEQLVARAATFDIWTVQELGAFGRGRALDWIKVSEETYRLQYPWQDGYEALTVQKDLLGHWDLSLTLRPLGGGAVRQRTLATQVASADAAAGLAEAFVLQERRSVTKLANVDAPWRKAPATENQIALLRKLRAPFNPKTITKGEASNLITSWQARKGR